MAKDYERFPRHARVRCCDPEHRDHQHAQSVGTVIDSRETWSLGAAQVSECEIAWDNVQATQRHDAFMLERHYTREDFERMRGELQAELQHLREDVS